MIVDVLGVVVDTDYAYRISPVLVKWTYINSGSTGNKPRSYAFTVYFKDGKSEEFNFEHDTELNNYFEQYSTKIKKGFSAADKKLKNRASRVREKIYKFMCKDQEDIIVL